MSVHESTRTVENRTHLRLPLKTHIIQPGGDIAEAVERYTKDLRQPADIIAVAARPHRGLRKTNARAPLRARITQMKREDAEPLIFLAFRQRIDVPSRWTATGLPLPENCGIVFISHSHGM